MRFYGILFVGHNYMLVPLTKKEIMMQKELTLEQIRKQGEEAGRQIGQLKTRPKMIETLKAMLASRKK